MQSTLVLNASYEPLSIIPATRALSLIVSERASSVSDSAVMFHSSSTTIPLPYVIRLERFVKKSSHAKPAKFSRRGVLVRDAYSCAYCGKYADTIDHVNPQMLGGESSYENCVAACTSCNRKKGHKTLKELNWAIPFKPKPPTFYATMLGKVRNNEEQFAAWETYILMFQPDLAGRYPHKGMEPVKV
jgi:5-methylcytosine-specific restriction endonuclease McrA